VGGKPNFKILEKAALFKGGQSVFESLYVRGFWMVGKHLKSEKYKDTGYHGRENLHGKYGSDGKKRIGKEPAA